MREKFCTSNYLTFFEMNDFWQRSSDVYAMNNGCNINLSPIILCGRHSVYHFSWGIPTCCDC